MFSQHVCERSASGIDDGDYAIFTSTAYNQLRENYAILFRFSSSHEDPMLAGTDILPQNYAQYCPNPDTILSQSYTTWVMSQGYLTELWSRNGKNGAITARYCCR